MIKFAVRLSASRLRELLHFDPETGVFRYRTRASQRTRVGDVAGSVNSNGYRHIRVDGRAYKAHRLAWLYVTGEWPPRVVDHINGGRDDNRIANLRLASRSENLANSRVNRAGKDAPKGVRRLPNGRWIARIQKNKRSIYLGYFQSQADATAAYAAAAKNLFGEFARA